jgi:hypothetical protein
MDGNDRKPDGTFAEHNPGGPGRPRRAVEQEYLAALSDAVSLDTWRRIVKRAAADAEAGDPKAREWLAKYLIGDKPPKLLELAAREAAGCTADREVTKRAKDLRRWEGMFDDGEGYVADLLEKAETGDMNAIKTVLDATLGPAGADLTASDGQQAVNPPDATGAVLDDCGARAPAP